MADTFKHAWCSMPGWRVGHGPLLYHAPLGELRVALEDETWERARTIFPEEHGLIVLALIDRMQSEIRYGAPRGASMLERDRLNVLRHSIFVAQRAHQLAQLIGLPPLVCLGVKWYAAKHDLHEALPGVRDIHGPPLRWLRMMSPEYDSVHRLAERAVTKLIPVPAIFSGGATRRGGGQIDAWHEAMSVAPALTKAADRDAMAVERALLFGDRPAWLGERVELIDMVRQSSYGRDEESITPYFAAELPWTIDWIDCCLRTPEVRFMSFPECPVPQRQIDGLRSWYIEQHACSAAST